MARVGIIYKVTNLINEKDFTEDALDNAIVKDFNIFLAKKRKNSKSKYKGVSPTQLGKWLSCIKINGKTENLGIFKDEKLAYTAYKSKLWEVSYRSYSRS